MTENQWAELRQVGFATLGHPAAVRAATELLELGPGFGDPLLAAVHLADFTAPIGPDTYVEVLAPTTPDHSVARWLRRVGGSSGWVLATQVPSLDGVQQRAAEHGVRIAVQTQAMGHDIVQLHPLDVGVLLELDEFLPRTGWFWDDLPAAKAAHARRSAKADDILAVDVADTDPFGMAATWPRAPRRHRRRRRDRLHPPDDQVRAPHRRPHRHRRRRRPRHRPRPRRRRPGRPL
jgi:hypothetical protein